MYCIALVLLASVLNADNQIGKPEQSPAHSLRMVDVNADGQLDQLQLGRDGSLSIAINMGQREFRTVPQTLPRAQVSTIFADDLNGDGSLDFYLLSPRANVVLLGDGSGRFFEATTHLGLADSGNSLSVERVDIDADGQSDLLLHNSRGDVIFWGTSSGIFERDASTPDVLEPLAQWVGPTQLPMRAGTGGPPQSNVTLGDGEIEECAGRQSQIDGLPRSEPVSP